MIIAQSCLKDCVPQSCGQLGWVWPRTSRWLLHVCGPGSASDGGDISQFQIVDIHEQLNTSVMYTL